MRPWSTSGKIAVMISASDIIRRVEEDAGDLQRFGVRRLVLFGSYARGEATEQSDIDFLVDYEPGHGGFRDYTGTLLLLENMFGKKIDLVKRGLLREELKPFILGSEQVEAHL